MSDTMDNEAPLSSDPVDPLLECLMILTRYYERPYSRDVLRAGLPLVDNRFTTELFTRSAGRIGLKTKTVKRPLTQISKLVLPAVLLLKNNQACVLQKIHDDETVDIAFPESGGISRKNLAELAEIYAGYAIFVQPEAHYTETSADPEEQKDKNTWFWGTLWKYRSNYFEVALAALFINLFALATPLFIMNVYDRVVPNNATITLWVLVIGIMIIFCFDMLLRVLRGYVIDVCGKKADTLMATYLFQHIMDMQLINKPRSVGAFTNNLREFETVRDFFTSSTLTTLVDLPFVILYIVFIAYIGSSIALAPAVAIPVVLSVGWLLQRPLNKIVKQALHGTSQKNSVLVESISGLETIKSLSAEGLVQKKWEHHVGNVASLSLRSRFLSGAVVHMAYYAQQIVYVLVIVMGVYLIQRNQLTLGGLIACNILAGRCLAPLGQMASMITRFQQAKVALQGLNKLMALSTEHNVGKRFLHRPTIKGEIDLSHITFQYPEQEGKALDDLSFSIKAGEHIGILGRIGSGKTTLQKLLLGLYHPQSGVISVDNVDSDQIDPVDLRRNIGYVPQETLLFSGTVRENIVMSQPWADDAAILRAAQLAGIDQFVNRHPAGFDMPVGERGETLSGGQRQSIAIARALLTDPNILLFDEPTSAMDERSERELIARLTPYAEKKTLLLITHKASLLSLVDRIIILDMGKVILDGPKDEILKKLTPAAVQKNH